MSERTAFGAAQDTHGSRTNVSNEMTLSLIALSDLLLAASAREVVLARVALVVARAGERERLVAVSSCSPAAQPQRRAAVLGAAVDARDHAAALVGDAAERVDQLREVLEVDLDRRG